MKQWCRPFLSGAISHCLHIRFYRKSARISGTRVPTLVPRPRFAARNRDFSGTGFQRIARASCSPAHSPP
jgi:hypothetical protein